MERKQVLAVATAIFGTCIILGVLFLYIVPSLNVVLNFDTTTFGTVLTIVGAFGTISGILLGIYNFRLQRRLAKEALKKADLGVLVVYDRQSAHSIIPDPELGEINFGCSVGEKDRVFCSIPFEIYNSGELSAENLSVRLMFPLALRGLKEPMKTKYVGIMGAENASKRVVYRDEHYEYVEYLCPDLGSHMRWRIQEQVDISYLSPFSESELQKLSNDRFLLKMHATIPPSIKVQVHIWAKHIKPISGYFYINRFDAGDMKELQIKIEEYRKNALRSALEKLSKDPKSSEAERAELLKDALAVMPRLSRAAAAKNGSSIYSDSPQQNAEVTVLETSGSKHYGLRLPDGSVLTRKVSDDTVLFRKGPDGSVQELKKKKKDNNDST